jgi:NhaA family Na+:H+ antiporter
VPIIPFLPHAARDAGLFIEASPDARDALSSFERAFKYPVQVVLFFFGFANAGVRFGAVGDGTWAVMIAIVAGKPIGICLAVALSVAAGLRLPSALRWTDVVVVGMAGGIGFTVALFFAVAAFPPGPILEQLKTYVHRLDGACWQSAPRDPPNRQVPTRGNPWMTDRVVVIPRR